MLRVLSKFYFSKGMPAPLVGVQWLKNDLNFGTVKIIDGTWYMPGVTRNAYEEFMHERIPGAVYFDIDKVCRLDTNLPHMLPPQEQFEKQMGELGFTEDDHIVVYDAIGTFSACRVYWTFRSFGHRHVGVLDGGLPLWKLFDGKVEKGQPHVYPPTTYRADPQPHLVRNLEQIMKNIERRRKGERNTEIVLDTRAEARFYGEAPEPRAGVKSGHMPFSINMPFTKFINTNTGEMIHEDQIRHLLKEHHIDWDKEKITVSCGSGMTASVLYVALEKIGAKHLALYDGSWTEYGAADNTEICHGRKHQE